MKALLVLLFLPLCALAQPAALTLVFSPESDRFTEATRDYEAIWAKEGARIVEAMESFSGLRFREAGPVRVRICECVSFSGARKPPMLLRASLRPNQKLGTMIHELGHRLIFQMRKRPTDADEHRVLNLFLYDVLVKLYGPRFADEQVAHESRLLKTYDYLAAWRWALALTPEERAARFRAIVEENR